METVNINPEQIQQLIEAVHYLGRCIFYSTMCICLCLGFNAWESSAK